MQISARNAKNKYFRLLHGDRLGMTSTISPIAIGYVTNFASPGSLFAGGERVYTIGDDVAFDALRVPYDFSLAAYVFVGDSNTTVISPTNSSVSHVNGTSNNNSTSGSGNSSNGSSGGVCYGTADTDGYVDCPELDQIVFQPPTAAPADPLISTQAVTQAPTERMFALVEAYRHLMHLYSI